MVSASPTRISVPGHYPFLDTVRFGAALLVAFAHTRGLFFTSIQNIDEPGLLTLAFYLLTSLHHEAVVVFFVISGFLVGGGALERMKAGTFSPRSYAVNRFSRIYIVLIPAILVAAAVTALGHQLFAETRFYAERPLFPSGFGSDWRWDQIPCHLAGLQGVYCEAFAFNGPLWSLGYEWLLYIAGPIVLAPLFLRTGRFPRLALFLALGLALAWITPMPEWPLFWFAGLGAAWIFGRWPVSPPVGLLALAACAAAFPVSSLGVLPMVATDLWICMTLAVAFTCPAVTGFSLAAGLMRRCADFSFSLYALHLPLGVFIGAALATAGWPGELAVPGVDTYSAFAVTIAAIILASIGFAALTERQTDGLRNLLNTLLSRPRFFGASAA